MIGAAFYFNYSRKRHVIFSESRRCYLSWATVVFAITGCAAAKKKHVYNRSHVQVTQLRITYASHTCQDDVFLIYGWYMCPKPSRQIYLKTELTPTKLNFFLGGKQGFTVLEQFVWLLCWRRRMLVYWHCYCLFQDNTRNSAVAKEVTLQPIAAVLVPSR